MQPLLNEWRLSVHVRTREYSRPKSPECFGKQQCCQPTFNRSPGIVSEIRVQSFFTA